MCFSYTSRRAHMLSSTDLLQPRGDIARDWFPGMSVEDVDVLLDRYLADGYARLSSDLRDTEKDNAARAWAMGRAARNVYMRLSNTPASLTLQGEGSQSITGEQIRAFKAMAERYEAEFETFSAADVEPDDAPSGSVANSYRW